MRCRVRSSALFVVCVYRLASVIHGAGRICIISPYLRIVTSRADTIRVRVYCDRCRAPHDHSFRHWFRVRFICTLRYERTSVRVCVCAHIHNRSYARRLYVLFPGGKYGLTRVPCRYAVLANSSRAVHAATWGLRGDARLTLDKRDLNRKRPVVVRTANAIFSAPRKRRLASGELDFEETIDYFSNKTIPRKSSVKYTAVTIITLNAV